MRVALLGYYDTGNIGDTAQEEVAKAALENAGHEVESLTIGCSITGRCRRIESEADVESLREFDAIIFGGGLLFQNFVAMLWHRKAWKLLAVPILLLCVGCEVLSPTSVDAHKRMVVRSVYVSGRRAWWEDDLPVELEIMQYFVLGSDLAYCLKRPMGIRQENALVVVSGADSAWMVKVPGIAESMGFDKVIFMSCFENPHFKSDSLAWRELDNWIGDKCELVVPQTVGQALRTAARGRAVISSKRHGSIFGAVCGSRPVVLVNHPRLLDVHKTFWDCDPIGTDADEGEIIERLSAAIESPVSEVGIGLLAAQTQTAIDGCLAALEGIAG